MINFDKLANAMGELDEDVVQEEVRSVTTAEEANQAMEACQAGMNTVGRLFEEGEYFVGDLIFAGELMTDAVEVLKPLLASSESTGTKTKMILCTVKDDLHDIGKNLVKMMMEGKGLEVVDLGTDVAPETYVQTAVEQGCQIICCSALLTTTMGMMEEVVKKAEEAGICDKVKIMVGGAPVTEAFCEQIGADKYTADAASAADAAVALCRASA